MKHFCCVVVVADPRNLSLKFGQNQVSLIAEMLFLLLLLLLIGASRQKSGSCGAGSSSVQSNQKRGGCRVWVKGTG